MRAPRRAWVLLALALIAPGPFAHAKAPPPPDPFRVPPDSLSGHAARIAVTRVRGARRAFRPVPDDSARVTPLVTAFLDSAGYAVVPAESVLVRWRRESAAAGGAFDPRTGAVDEARVAAALERTRAVLRDTLGVEWWATWELVTTEAAFDGDRATWDGVRRDIGRQGLLTTLIIGSTEGVLPAYSVEVRIVDADGRVLYSRRGGLVPTLRRVKDRWTSVPADEAFASPSATETGVRIALGPWLERVRPATRAANE